MDGVEVDHICASSTVSGAICILLVRLLIVITYIILQSATCSLLIVCCVDFVLACS